MSLTASDIVRLLKSDREALKELSAALFSEPELRLAVINAVIADMATKHDIQQLRQEMRSEVAQLRQEIGQLRQEMREEVTQLRQEIGQLRQDMREEITQLRQDMRTEVAQLRQEIGQLRRDMAINFRWTMGLIIAIWGTTVIPLLMRMAGVI